MRPIDADALGKYLNARIANLRKDYGNYDAYTDGVDDALTVVELAPTLTLDDFGIVRCKNCKYWQDNNEGYPHPECRWGNGETPDPDDYCSFGAKMGGGQ